LEFPIEIRKLVYTTNDREPERQIPASRPTPRPLPQRAGSTEDPLPDSAGRRPNRSNPTGQINDWKHILNTLAITYGDRLGLN
jgi:hypothetical protein